MLIIYINLCYCRGCEPYYKFSELLVLNVLIANSNSDFIYQGDPGTPGKPGKTGSQGRPVSSKSVVILYDKINEQ